MSLRILTILLLLLSCLVASDSAATSSDHDEALWVEVQGEAVGSEFDPPKEVMERARNEAKRKALDEAVGSFLRSHTLVSNGQLAEEMTFARLRGRIEKVQTVSEERDRNDPNLYRVKLKALVRPVYPQEGEGIQVKLSLSRETLSEGEEVKVLYQTNVDCHVYLFSIAEDNSVTLLLPNSIYRDSFVKGNSGRVFPPDGAALRLKAMALPGMKNRVSREKIKLIATRQREILLERGFQEGMFKVYDARSTGLVGDLARKLNQLDPADWGEAMAVYSIEPGGSGVPASHELH